LAGLLCLCGLFFVEAPQAKIVSGSHYQFLQNIQVGGEGGWDYLSIDPESQRLYLSHGTKVVVIDLKKNSLLGEVKNTPGVHGIAIASELGRGFSSNGKENTVSVFDLSTLATITKVPAGENPDAIRYDSGTSKVFVFNGKSASVTIIDAKSATVIATLPLAGKPEFAAVDPDLHRVYVNLEDKDKVTVIDSVKNQIIANWSASPGESPAAMAIDTAHHRLFIGCHNQKMIMMDSVNGKVLGSVPIGKGVDALAFDPRLEFVISSNGEGNATVAHVDKDGKFTVVETIVTESGARTLALNPKGHRLYFPTGKFQKAVQGQHPQIIPDTLKVMVFGPAS
jgi:YVTN family beta-propeller protein